MGLAKTLLSQIIAAAFADTKPYMWMGMNLAWVNTWSGAVPFSNLCYQMGSWSRVTGSGSYSQDHGALTASSGTDEFRAYLSDTGLGLPAGTYTVLNPDGCQLAVGDYSTPTQYCGWTSATQFTFSYPGGLFLGLWNKGGVTRNNGNLAIILPGHLAGWQSGNIWNSAFLSFYQALGLKVLRTMDWTLASQNFETNWADRTPADRIGISNQFAGANVVPYEFICDLANRLSVDPWVCVPARATQDYVTQMAALFAARLGPGRSLWLEHGNEIWNYGSPWGDGTNWIANLSHTRYTATANYDTNTFTLNAHGLSHGEIVTCYTSRENILAGISVDWTQKNGTTNYVEVVDANTIKLRQGSVAGTLSPVTLGQVNVLFTRNAEPGKTEDLNGNYGALCIRNWDAFDAVLGTGRVKHIVAAQAANAATTSGRLAADGVQARADYVAIAPYFTGAWFGGAVDIASGQLTPKFWGNKNATVHVSVYPAASTPTVKDIIAGTGAVNHQSISYSAGANSFSAGSVVAGLADGTQYKVHFVAVIGGYSWPMSVAATPSATPSTVYAYDSYANQATRNRLNTIAGGMGRVSDHLAVSNGVPVICYEGGLHFHESAPAQVSTWLYQYLESTEFAAALRHDLYSLAAAGTKYHVYYSDVLGNTFAVANTYADTADNRYAAMQALRGKVEKRPALSVANATGPDITAAPTYPYIVYAAPDASLTYSIVAGNEGGNFDVSGALVRMVNGAGVDWAAPTVNTLTIEATDGYTATTFTVQFTTGSAWFEADTSFAWSSIDDADPDAINPSVGSSLARVAGTGATVASGLWDMDGNRYASATGLSAALSGNNAILVAAVLDKDNQSSTYNTILKVGSTNFLSIETWTASEIVVRMYTSIVNKQAKPAASAPAGKHVYWGFYNPADTSWTVGYDQVQATPLTGANNAGTTIDRTVSIGGASSATSQMKHGAVQVINRAGMTLADALAIVAKMQTLHGIA